ncbi:hypothetical protein PV325_003706 [Microctonus aethiopoides]|uniref:HEAT repeat-containing protein 2 n=1 Tax=Microctonus aethiopoides TaxID=144406 RepID=A0AA39KM00_9HYME|nr:hypothetical protein PV325_003706 [Microctonus aethiopoides]KAK0166359.1 hypothetical protein PV328_004785 [Microctonus aethiopoides]
MSRVEELQLSEICLSLQSTEKAKRIKSLEKMYDIIKDDDKQWSKEEIVKMWQIMNKHMAKHLTDPSESCRNLSIDITKIFLESLPVFDKHIMYIIPILVRRLSPQEILESSEEVRLNCVTLLRVIIRLYKDYLAVYIDDFIAILSRTVMDNYQNVKRESCEAISELAKSIPAQFYTKSEAIIKPILSNFTHQHYRVRVASVNAIGDVLQYGNSKSMTEVSTPLAERLFDQSGAVRAAVVKVAGNWLVHLRDRYSWWYKIIPLLLTGLHDDIQEIRTTAAELWDTAGKVYLQENESDEKIKDKMDYLIEDPQHYPPNIPRPNLGCRIIVQQNVGKLVGGISRELGDWKQDIRVRSAQLLAVLTLNSEQNITQHIENLLPAMYRACNDEDQRVVDNVVLAAEYIGYFVPPNVYCGLVLPTLEDGNITTGHLTVFAAILRGSERDSLSDELMEIGKFLQAKHICRSKKSNYQWQILNCCESLLQVCQQDCNVIAHDMFVIIFTVWSMAQTEKNQMFAKHLMETLAKVAMNQELTEFYAIHLREIFILIKDTASNWNIYSPEFYLFKFCLSEARTVCAKNIDLVQPILETTMNKDSDSELRLKLFIILSDFFMHRDEILKEMKEPSNFVEKFLVNILIPGLIWSAGKIAEALRTAATGCLCALIDESNHNEMIDKNKVRFDKLENCSENSSDIFIDKNQFLKIFDELRPILISLVDDNARKTRLYALRAICSILNIGLKFSCITDENVISTYPAVIKRLDDGCDDVRCAAVEALVFIWRALPSDYDLEFGKSHVDYLYTCMIVHLDDPEKEFQDLMLDAMIQLAKIHPQMLAQKIEKCRSNFRNQSALDKLMKHMSLS